MSEMVPEGWKYQRLGICSQILDSKRIPLNAQERAKRKGVYPYYGANGIQDYIDDFIFDGEYILLAEDGGYFSDYESRPIAQYVKGQFWVNNHAHILKSTDGSSNKWIYYSLVHKNILKYINGGTRSKLNQSDLRDIGILLPPLAEQKKIASILTSVDQVIEKTESEISKLQDLKKGMMQQLLTQGIGHIQFKDSPVGRIPMGWEVKKIGDFAVKVKPGPFGSSLKKSSYVQSGYKVYGQEQVIKGDIKVGDYFINQAKFDELVAFRIAKGDILLSLVGTFGKVLIVPDQFEEGIINPRLLLIRLNQTIDPYFVAYQLNSHIVSEQLKKVEQGGTMGVLSGRTVKPIRMILPPLAEQKKIASILTSIDDSIQQQQRELQQTQNLKKSLMQDLLTGKVRVKVD